MSDKTLAYAIADAIVINALRSVLVGDDHVQAK